MKKHDLRVNHHNLTDLIRVLPPKHSLFLMRKLADRDDMNGSIFIANGLQCLNLSLED